MHQRHDQLLAKQGVLGRELLAGAAQVRDEPGHEWQRARDLTERRPDAAGDRRGKGSKPGGQQRQHGAGLAQGRRRYKLASSEILNDHATDEGPSQDSTRDTTSFCEPSSTPPTLLVEGEVVERYVGATPRALATLELDLHSQELARARRRGVGLAARELGPGYLDGLRRAGDARHVLRIEHAVIPLRLLGRVRARAAGLVVWKVANGAQLDVESGATKVAAHRERETGKSRCIGARIE